MHQFNENRNAVLLKDHRQIVIGGSSGAFSEKLTELFEQKTSDSVRVMTQKGNNVIVLSQGIFKKMWDYAYGIVDIVDQNLAMEQAFDFEQKYKDKADIIVWQITQEAISQAAVTEIGFMLLDALTEGKQLIVLLEPFDMDLYAATRMREEAPKMKDEVITMLIQSQFSADLCVEALVTIEDILSGRMDGKIDYAFLKKTGPLKETSTFKKAENVRRVRGIAEHQLAKLEQLVRETTGKYGTEIFTFCTDPMDLAQRLDLIKDKASSEKRLKYYDNMNTFLDELRSLTETENATAEQKTNFDRDRDTLQMIDQALEVVSPKETRFKPLLAHLAEVTAESQKYCDILSHFQNPNNPFLTSRELELIVRLVSPLHDLAKLLGSPDMQAMPDHEKIIGIALEIAMTSQSYPKEEIAFVVGLISDHENIFKEAGRIKFATSNNHIERGKSLFFVLDTLTGSISEENGELHLDETILNTRFTDLYFRHMDLVRGKVFRPEWGILTLQDFLAFFEELQKQGATLEAGFFDKLINAAQNAITNTLDANNERIVANISPATDRSALPVFTDNQVKRINEAKVDILAFQAKFTRQPQLQAATNVAT